MKPQSEPGLDGMLERVDPDLRAAAKALADGVLAFESGHVVEMLASEVRAILAATEAPREGDHGDFFIRTGRCKDCGEPWTREHAATEAPRFETFDAADGHKGIRRTPDPDLRARINEALGSLTDDQVMYDYPTSMTGPMDPVLFVEFDAFTKAILAATEAPLLPSRPDPNAVEVAPGTFLHHGLYLRGSR